MSLKIFNVQNFSGRLYYNVNMKITIATGLYPPEIGGPATYATMLEKELPARGFVVKVVPFGLVRHYPKVIRHIVYTWRLWRESKKTDVIYALDPTSVGLPALVVSWLTGRVFVLRVPGDYAWEQAQFRFGVTDRLHDFIKNRYGYGLRTSLLCWMEGFVAKNAKRVIVPSYYVKYVVEQWGVDKNNIQVIYSALSPLETIGSYKQIREQLNYNGFTIVSASRLVPNKGFSVLLEVFSELLTMTDVTLIIIGDRPEQDKLKNLVMKFNMSDKVKFTGKLSKLNLGTAIKGADLFVLNTAHEGLSHQLIEVMDIGTPIVTTRVGGNPELITDGVHGYLVPFNDHNALKLAIIHAIEHPELLRRIVQSARGRSKQFSKDIVIKQIDQMLREIS